MARTGTGDGRSKTTIWVARSTAERLRRVGKDFAEFRTPTYDEIIRRLINYRETNLRGVDPELLQSSGKKG